MTITKRVRIALFCALLGAPVLARAHSFWLAPDHYRIAAPGSVKVDFRVGDGDDAEPWTLRWDRIVSLIDHGDHGVSDKQAAITVSTASDPGGAVVTFDAPGSHVLAFASQPSTIELPADAFNAYAAEEGLSAVLAERETIGTAAKSGRELYSRRAKMIVQVGDQITDNVTRPIGQTLEIVPERNPHALGADRMLPVQILFRGMPLKRGLVELIDLKAPKRPVARQLTGDDGRTSFRIPERGAWRLNLIWSVPDPGNARADFETIFSSLTFGYE